VKVLRSHYYYLNDAARKYQGEEGASKTSREDAKSHTMGLQKRKSRTTERKYEELSYMAGKAQRDTGGREQEVISNEKQSNKRFCRKHLCKK